MKVKELMDRLMGFDPDMEVKILPKPKILPITEHIINVEVSKHPCPNICVLIEGF